MQDLRFNRGALGALAWLCLILPCAAAVSTVLGPWTPLFKGVEHAVGTNTPGGDGFASRQVVHAVRVDLTDPDVRLFASPRMTNYEAEVRETAGLTVKDFLTTHGLQLAINVNFFDPQQYYLPAGTPMDVFGLLISEGTVVSEQEGAAHAASVVFSSDNEAMIIHTNWPAISTERISTAVSGDYPVLVAGVNVGFQYLGEPGFVHGLNPRTAFGLSQDRRTLYLLTIDGRQHGYSDGALDWEIAAWMLLMGAYDAVNMDGGGSTTLVMADSTGAPIELNRSSAVADSGHERTVGAHFGIYAKPVPGFINDVTATPDDTAATITWTTPEPAIGQVNYGITADLGSQSALESVASTNHATMLAGLSPDTTYYFAVTATEGTTVQQSPTFVFTTTNYVTTNVLIEVTNSWKYTASDLDGAPWTTHGYDDSAWAGPGAGLLWIDVDQRGPNPEVQPKNTQLPENQANSGYPYITYYFRAHFNVANRSDGSSLVFSTYVDDGAVFYLNGQEVYRLNMESAPAPILNSTLATGYSYDGDATRTVDFAILGDLATNLVVGDNLLAVEVHNYHQLSPDVTFGMSLQQKEPKPAGSQLSITSSNGIARLTWSRSGFRLQEAEFPNGPWIDVPGPIVSSPFTTEIAGSTRYFRLMK